MMDINILWLVIGLVIVLGAVGYFLVRRQGQVGPAIGELPTGWQFCTNPTTLDKPGTVFRIDAQGRRYVVDELKVKIQTGEEAIGTVDETVNAKAGIIARFVGLPNLAADMATQKVEHFEYQLKNPTIERIMDVELSKVLPAFLAVLDYRDDNRYFIIREARKASAIRYKLTRKQVDDFGGEASVGQQMTAKGKVFSAVNSKQYVLEQKFETLMRVMFLPEEIMPITAGLAAEKPQLGLMPVKEQLSWQEE